ncbi:MAG: hypothetical protein IJD80_05835, partial [Oscillospiraceae bacterium]|nr:hypothetical protein [Oscillospiraceae bacterium]
MENLFLYITHLSLKACVVIPIIAVVRFLLKRQPKSYSYALWSVVFLSLVFNIQIPPPQHSGINTPVSHIQNKLLSRYEDTLNSYTGNVQIHYTDSVEYYKALENGIKPVYDEKTDTQYVATDAVTNQAAATVSDHIPKICMLWCAGILAAVFVIIKNSLDIKSRLK